MFSRLVLVLPLFMLAACVTPSPQITTDPASQQQALQVLNAFRVTGGLGVWTDEESISTRIEWQQMAEDFDILVQLPAGLSSVRVAQKNGQAMVQNGSAAPVSGSSASRLMQQALGLDVAVPIEQMSLWIRGLPGNQAQSVKYDEQGRLRSMDYIDGQNTRWRAKVLKYTTFENTYVPATILANGGPYTVRLVLKEWSKQLSETDTAAKQAKPGGRLKVPNR